MAHEDLNRQEDVEGSSDRSFGVVFACVFLIIAAWPLLQSGAPRWWAAGVAAVFAVVALARPALLAPLNSIWMKFGILLGKIVAPIALGILFFVIITPLAMVMRLVGKDPLSLKQDNQANSYWVKREPPGPPPNSMTNQF